MKRVLLSLLRASVASISSIAALSCSANATHAECTDMLDRYIEMTLGGDPEMPPAEARAERETKKTLRKGEASYKRVQEQCEAEVSRREYRCAMKAPTPETWQACID